jgi:hypothetical protein
VSDQLAIPIQDDLVTIDTAPSIALPGCSYIYAPAGQAGEYAPLAANLYRGCGHRCSYCFVPSIPFLKMSRQEFDAGATAKPDYLSKLAKDARKYQKAGITEQVCFSFTTDVYNPFNTSLTRPSLQIVQEHGMGICVLTKGGKRALADIDLYRPDRDCFASTLTSLDAAFSLKWERNAALPDDRLATLRAFHDRGIFTWVSLEPTLDVESSLAIVAATHGFVDLYKIGRANYLGEITRSTDWRDYTVRMIDVCQRLGVKHYIKKDLQPYLPVDYYNPLRVQQHHGAEHAAEKTMSLKTTGNCGEPGHGCGAAILVPTAMGTTGQLIEQSLATKLRAADLLPGHLYKFNLKGKYGAHPYKFIGRKADGTYEFEQLDPGFEWADGSSVRYVWAVAATIVTRYLIGEVLREQRQHGAVPDDDFPEGPSGFFDALCADDDPVLYAEVMAARAAAAAEIISSKTSDNSGEVASSEATLDLQKFEALDTEIFVDIEDWTGKVKPLMDELKALKQDFRDRILPKIYAMWEFLSQRGEMHVAGNLLPKWGDWRDECIDALKKKMQMSKSTLERELRGIRQLQEGDDGGGADQDDADEEPDNGESDEAVDESPEEQLTKRLKELHKVLAEGTSPADTNPMRDADRRISDALKLVESTQLAIDDGLFEAAPCGGCPCAHRAIAALAEANPGWSDDQLVEASGCNLTTVRQARVRFLAWRKVGA